MFIMFWVDTYNNKKVSEFRKIKVFQKDLKFLQMMAILQLLNQEKAFTAPFAFLLLRWRYWFCFKSRTSLIFHAREKWKCGRLWNNLLETGIRSQALALALKSHSEADIQDRFTHFVKDSRRQGERGWKDSVGLFPHWWVIPNWVSSFLEKS